MVAAGAFLTGQSEVVIGLTLALLVALAVIEFLGRPVEAAPPPRPAPE